MVLSVIFNAGAVPLSLDDQINYYPSSSSTSVESSPADPEYVHFLEELVGEFSGVFATLIHQNPPPSSPTSLADMYHQRTNTCRSSSSGKNLFHFSSLLGVKKQSRMFLFFCFNCCTANYPAVKEIAIKSVKLFLLERIRNWSLPDN